MQTGGVKSLSLPADPRNTQVLKQTQVTIDLTEKTCAKSALVNAQSQALIDRSKQALRRSWALFSLSSTLLHGTLF